ncbi:serine/threonine protein kinase [Minicystis rosea]|nr:serine/threonine protein kinase [Minicystis rosea]
MMDTASTSLVAGRFRIEREIGRGAAGIVYRATDTLNGIQVALKVIAATGTDAVEQARFAREGQVLSELDHPGIVRVVAFGSLEAACPDGLGRRLDEGSAYIAMEWLDGEDLQARQRRAPLPLRQSLEIGQQVALALAAAHDADVVHRDIKPSNIFILGGGEAQPASGVVLGDTGGRARGQALYAKLVDFGVASSSDALLTQTGSQTGAVGTPAYMAPEQARGDATADARSDIYSLGATLFELIAGRPPHMGTNSIATLARLVTTPAPRLSELLLDVPPRLDDLIHRMLSSNPDDRPASATEVASAIDDLLRDENLSGLTRAAEAPAQDRASGTGTRFVTTIVALHVARGDERAQEIDRLREQGADALPLGDDSIVAHLGTQRSYGDEGARALELGLALSARGARVGVATGRMRLDRKRSTGEVVDRAAALAREAGGGGILADTTTADLARGRFQFKVLPRGMAMVTGLALRKDAGAIAPFVGRDAELIATLNAYDRCTEDATPVIVTVSGPPGIGKSRLGREFVSRLLARPESKPERRHQAPRLMHVRCESYGRSQALGVATDALRSLLGLSKGASLEQAEQAVAERRLQQRDGGLLARLLANQPFPEGIDPRGARDSLYLSMTELVLGAAATEPCAMMIEDAQWSDPESIAWVDHLLARGANRPFFAMLLIRPSFWRGQGQRFVGRDHVRIELRPIARRATREIARAMIGAAASDAMLDQVAQQAAGSPLFAEELARVIAAGKDMGKAPTIEAAIQVSLDALEETTRDAVVRASVFGMSVWDGSLTALGVAEPESALRKLVAAEMIVENASSRFAGTREFIFKHALVRDVAYASAGEDLKKDLHASAARWLAVMGEDAATVAQHFDLGGLHEEAADHWENAARRALATNSLREAVTMADRALTFAEQRPVAFARAVLLDEAYSRLDARASERDSAIRAMSENVFDEASELRTMGARARYDDACASGSPDIEDRLIHVRDRARALDLVDEEARCSATLAQRHAFAGALVGAEREAAALLDLAERRSIVWAAVDAWQVLAVVHQTRGELATALEARRNAARAARAAGLQEREAILTMNVGFALTTIGAWEEALSEIQTGLGKAQEIGSAGGVRHGQMVLLCWAATYGADARLDAALSEPRESADEAAAGTWVVRDRATLGVLFYRGCELLRGDTSTLPKARALLKTAAEAYRSTDNRDVLPVALGFWAEAERRFGHADQGVEIASEAARLIEAGAPCLLNEAPIYLALHDACVDMGDLTGARDAMQRGVAPLLRRLKGLEGTPYARSFLLGLPHNSALLAAAEAYGCIPEEIERLLRRTES